jgi:hypothetical protein
MSNEDKKAAKEHAGRAARQMRHATRNAGEAAESVADAVKDDVVEGASEAKGAVQELAKKAIYTEAGRGILFVSVGLIAAGVGVKKFQEVNREYKKLRYPMSAGRVE